MSVIKRHYAFRTVTAPVLSAFLAASVCLNAQQQKPSTWLQDLDYLQTSAGADDTARQERVTAICLEVKRWIELHPGARVALAAMPPQPWSEEQMAAEIKQLRVAVETIARLDPGHPFHLGSQQVQVTATVSMLSPAADAIDQPEIAKRNATTVAKALDLLPGVSIQHLANNRNEAGVLIRGFSSRGQVPLYQDGIPIYVPYDGYIDFNRFLTSDLAEIQVAKGFSSPLLGPNGLGGSINLVTREPGKKLEGNGAIGTGSGDALLSSFRLGSRWGHLFAQGSLDWLQNSFIPLSGNYQVRQYSNLPDIKMTGDMNHSNSRDERYAGRVGWTPTRNGEYVFSYDNQKGQKGVPLYAGTNTAAKFPNFWNWPFWNKTSYYVLTTTPVGEDSTLRFRALYDQFRNGIDMYSNDTFTVLNTANSEYSRYSDHTYGGSSDFTTRAVRRNLVSASAFFKDDTHRERGIYPARSPYPLVQPYLVDRDQQTSFGLQDGIALTARVYATIGFSADHFNGLQGQSYTSSLNALVPFTCTSDPANTSFGGCTLHTWNFNPQASVSYAPSAANTFFVTFADRGRFPMLKDIYSASMGAGLPNPNLTPEHGRTWDFGYSHSFYTSTQIKAELFRTDLRDAIESVYVTDPGGTASAQCPSSKISGYCNQMINIGSEVHQGVEVEIHSAPVSRLTLDASYSYLNRTIAYNFGDFNNVSKVNTSISILPTMPKNKLLGTANVRLPREISAFAAVRYEGGLTLQDTTYASTSPLYKPYAEAYATVDAGAEIPLRQHVQLQAGIKNLFDRNYFYTAGYPEIGRNWFFNTRFRF